MIGLGVASYVRTVPSGLLSMSHKSTSSPMVLPAVHPPTRDRWAQTGSERLSPPFGTCTRIPAEHTSSSRRSESAVPLVRAKFAGAN